MAVHPDQVKSKTSSMDPLSAIAAGGSLLSGIGSMLGTKKREKRQHEYNMKMAEYKYNKDLEMWNRQWERETQYNDPKAQMERLKAAGINPHLAYASGGLQNVAQTGSIPEYSIPEMDVAPSTGELAAGMLENTIGMTANLLNIKKDRALVRSMEAQASVDETKARLYRDVGFDADLYKTENERDRELARGQVFHTARPGYGNQTTEYFKQLKQEVQRFNIDTELKRLAKNGVIHENDVKEYKAKLAKAEIDPDSNPIVREILKAMAEEGIPFQAILQSWIRKLK